MASSSSSPQEIVEYQHQQSRSIASPKLYDAFISHRGPDVKHTLAKQLYDLLKARQCRAFLDREEIEGGDSIPFAIHNGICSSVVQIAIFSKRYAESKWCLDELVLMLKQTDALFIPVFYEVKPWELRHTEKGVYAAAFSDYQSKQRYLDKVDEWKKALATAADISGYEHSEHKDNLCGKIVSRVEQEMEKRMPLHVAKYPVGLAEIVQDFEESSCSEIARDKVTIAGIFGLGGSGKTTLAKELFNRKRSGYDASSFLSDVREAHANRDLPSLQSNLLKDLFNEENRVFSSVDEGIGALEHRLERARDWRFLIVLDDVDHQDQLDALLPEAMLSSGSLVIITTRDQSVLKGADICYNMKALNRDLAKDLFCSHAFCGQGLPIAYEKLVESFVEFCGGLPLSLKVLGAHVYGRNEYYWELELEKVKNIQPKDIIQRLKISFDGLDSQEKQIFIDIACFFNKIQRQDLKRMAMSMWNASGWSAEHAVETLKDKCLLVEVWEDENKDHPRFEMHDHLRDLGRQMAQDLGPPRLWKPELLRSMEAKGFKQILAETKGRCFHSFTDSSLDTEITYFISSLNDSAETELLWLEIGKYSDELKSIPSWIPLLKLCCLSVENVEELWSAFQQQMQTNTQASFELRILRISHHRRLDLPDLIRKFNHLEELEISGSWEKTDMTSLLQSLQQLSNLRLLQLGANAWLWWGTESLSGGREVLLGGREPLLGGRMFSLKFESLGCISKLVISGEMCPRLRSLTVLAMVDLNEMDLQELDRLNTLEVLSCDKLETISGLSSLTGLQCLTVTLCSKLETISGLSYLRCLERINIGRCDQLQRIEGVEELQGLKSLVIVVHENGDPSVCNCINGLRRLPSEYTILIGKGEWSRLNVNLFSEVIGAPAVAEIEGEQYFFGPVEMRSSWSAITMLYMCLQLVIHPLKLLHSRISFHKIEMNGWLQVYSPSIIVMLP